MKRKIAIYTKDTGIILAIVQDPLVLTTEVRGENNSFVSVDWDTMGFVEIPRTYDAMNHLARVVEFSTTTANVTDSVDVVKTTFENEYNNSSYDAGHDLNQILSETPVDEYDSIEAVNNEVHDLIVYKIRSVYTVDQECELQRKMIAITAGIFIGDASAQGDALDDFNDYNIFVEQCITDAKTELGV